MNTITVTTRGQNTSVDAVLYRHIFENSIVADHPRYLQSLNDGRISLSQLIELCRQGKIAYSLFFGSYKVVAPMLEAESARLFGDFGGKYSISVRGRAINLNTVRLIIKDIKLKQEKIARFVKTPPNPNVKYLKNSPRPLSDQAQCIVDRLGINMDEYRSSDNKRDALWYLIGKLETSGIFVSLENTGTNMPQTLKRADGLTGVYVKHKKFPYFFVANEGLADFEELPGRKVFTLVYLAACLFKGSSRMVGFDQGTEDTPGNELFQLTELILMPEYLMPQQSTYTTGDLDRIANELKVTALAVLVRLRHLEYIEHPEFISLKNELYRRYQVFSSAQKKKRDDRKDGFRHNITRNILAYQGKAFLRVLRDQYRAKRITRHELNHQLSYGKGGVEIERIFDEL